MPKHLNMLNSLRVKMVQKRYPAKLINIISRIYLVGLEETAQKKRRKKRENQT